MSRRFHKRGADRCLEKQFLSLQGTCDRWDAGTQVLYSIDKGGWKRRGATWKEPGFKQGATNPVADVSRADVKAFSEWLTKRERGSGALPESLHYRLPTDNEWSAVGLDSEQGNTPQEKDSKIRLFPWGTKWPPP